MRFKGLGEMNPTQLRETVMAPQTRRLLQLTISGNDKTDQLMDMLLAKKRVGRSARMAGREGQPRAGLKGNS